MKTSIYCVTIKANNLIPGINTNGVYCALYRIKEINNISTNILQTMLQSITKYNVTVTEHRYKNKYKDQLITLEELIINVRTVQFYYNAEIVTKVANGHKYVPIMWLPQGVKVSADTCYYSSGCYAFFHISSKRSYVTIDIEKLVAGSTHLKMATSGVPYTPVDIHESLPSVKIESTDGGMIVYVLQVNYEHVLTTVRRSL